MQKNHTGEITVFGTLGFINRLVCLLETHSGETNSSKMLHSTILLLVATLVLADSAAVSTCIARLLLDIVKQKTSMFIANWFNNMCCYVRIRKDRFMVKNTMRGSLMESALKRDSLMVAMEEVVEEVTAGRRGSLME